MISEAYCMDCMDAMKEFPDKFFDLAVVDPPYGVGSVVYMPRERKEAFGGYIDKYEITIATLDINQRQKVKVNVAHNGNSKETLNHFGDDNVSPNPLYFEELFRVSKNQIIWGGNYFILPPSRGFIIWEKTTVAESFSMAMCEYAWCSLNTNAKIFKGAPQGTANDKRIHPTQKPVALYAWIYKLYAKQGYKILDTHMGSGSSRIAAYDAGLDYWGYEISKEYFDKQEKRFSAYTSQLSLFHMGEEK